MLHEKTTMKPTIRIRHASAVGLCCVFALAFWQWQRQSAPGSTAVTSAPVVSAAASLSENDPSIAPATRSAASPSSSSLSKLVVEVEQAVRLGDYPGAHQLVDDALAASSSSSEETQQLMSIKLGLHGRSGDYPGMLATMDQIIAANPKSAFAQKMAHQRTLIQDFSQRDPHDSGMCSTCNGKHAEGEPHLPKH